MDRTGTLYLFYQTSIHLSFRFKMLVTQWQKYLINKVINASDLTHNALAVSAASLLIPALPKMTSSAVATTHLASFAVGFGAQTWHSFVAGPTMFLNLQRQTFGDVQARLFPKMAQVCSSTGIVCLATYMYTHPSCGHDDRGLFLIATGLVSNLVNQFILFPLTAKFQYERRDKQEDNDARKSIERRFNITHDVSVSINFVALFSAAGYLYMVGSKMQGHW